MDPFARFSLAVADPASMLPLDEATLCIAAVLEPGVDVEAGLQELDELAGRCPAPTLDALMRHLFGRGGGLVLQFRRMVAEVKRTLPGIRQHTLIFHPRHDDQSDLANAFDLQRRLGGLVEAVILDDCYHLVTLDQQRHIVMDRSIDFVGRLAVREGEQSVAEVVKGTATAD